MSARPALKFKLRRGNAFRANRTGEWELGVVQEARFWRPIPMRADLLRRSTASLAKRVRSGTTTSYRCSSFRGRERSVDPRRLRRAVRHLLTNSTSPVGERRPSAFGCVWRRGKVRLAFRLHTTSLVKDRPRYASLSASQWLSRSGIPRPPLRVCWMQTRLRTIGLRLPQSNLERDLWSVSRGALGRGSTVNQ